MALVSVSVWAEEGKPNENTIHIWKITCQELMSDYDLDREMGISFFPFNHYDSCMRDDVGGYHISYAEST